ncbi:hypothetical protein [Cerasicoccus arenae]|uniref:Uncharacterized protein n=1 Tax=Cerasicoccus arenae TaxID=424488 RepID=A0A8J3GF31_9BACT|nr:hypothetical protein [Cerasicoccus arenae]MBK1860083.1 hypothetical protein [Cerasicoccus arenae]GHC14195.1 hypothetical protein GCM10007047_34280 [Cerasicoccus arenae]
MIDELRKVIKSDILDYDTAKLLVYSNWQGWIDSFPKETRQKAESTFVFLEGFIHEVDDGFVSKGHDQDSFDRVKRLLELIDSKADTSQPS